MFLVHQRSRHTPRIREYLVCLLGSGLSTCIEVLELLLGVVRRRLWKNYREFWRNSLWCRFWCRACWVFSAQLYQKASLGSLSPGSSWPSRRYQQGPPGKKLLFQSLPAYKRWCQWYDWYSRQSTQCGLSRSGQVGYYRWTQDYQAWCPGGRDDSRYEHRKQPSTTAWLKDAVAIYWAWTIGQCRYYGSLSLVGLIACLYQVSGSVGSYTRRLCPQKEEWWVKVHSPSRLQAPRKDLNHRSPIRLWCSYHSHAWNLPQPSASSYLGGISSERISLRACPQWTALGRYFSSSPSNESQHRSTCL